MDLWKKIFWKVFDLSRDQYLNAQHERSYNMMNDTKHWGIDPCSNIRQKLLGKYPKSWSTKSLLDCDHLNESTTHKYLWKNFGTILRSEP